MPVTLPRYVAVTLTVTPTGSRSYGVCCATASHDAGPRYTDRTRYTIRHATPRPRSTGPCPCPWPSGVMGSTAVPEGASAAGRILRMPLALPLAHRSGSGQAPAVALAHPWPPPRRSVNGAAFQRRWVRSAGWPGTPHIDPPYKPPPPGAAGLLRPGAGPSGSAATVEGPAGPA